MPDINAINEKFYTFCFTMDEDDIYKLAESDNVPVHNVIANIEPHCYGAMLLDSSKHIHVNFFFITNEPTLKGDIIVLNINDEDYYYLLLKFAVLLNKSYNIDTIDVFNEYQRELQYALEKYGFYTVTSTDLDQLQRKESFVIKGNDSYKGTHKIQLINKVEYYRNILGYQKDTTQVAGEEYVYLMLDNNSSLIKIGYSKDPGYRERTLHSQQPQIEIIGYWRGNMEQERTLHSQFKEKRIRGEWFQLSLPDLYAIAAQLNRQL